MGAIVEAGERLRGLYIIVSGCAQVVMGGRTGNNLILAILKAGDHFGDMELLEDLPLAANVIAREPCDILTLDKAHFSRCLEENMELAMAVLRSMARRLREAGERMGSLALLDVDGRLAEFLLRESVWVDGARIVNRGFSKRDIGQMIGASRERVSCVMKQMQLRGLIEERGDSILLHEQIRSHA
ncbi:MAG: Crp/Fnr family transcriptional regulator [Betaproteobacteria bacterium]|nr:Crp/Fnr family transcriptional regulator [Betaproteobacteria bacterium]